MATQGIVSVIVNGQVACKAIAGCDGYNAPRLASMVACDRHLRARDLYPVALAAGFGCRRCLVVMDDTGVIIGVDSEKGLTLPDLYRRTFGDPRFNPRWERGTADYVEVVEL